MAFLAVAPVVDASTSFLIPRAFSLSSTSLKVASCSCYIFEMTILFHNISMFLVTSWGIPFGFLSNHDYPKNNELSINNLEIIYYNYLDVITKIINNWFKSYLPERKWKAIYE
jgi:hypothetical protein